MRKLVVFTAALAVVSVAPTYATDIAANAVYEQMQASGTAPYPAAVLEKVYAIGANYLPGHAEMGIEPRDAVIKMMAGSQQHLRKGGGKIDMKFRVVDRKRFGDVYVDSGYLRRTIKPKADAPEQVSFSKFVTVIAKQPEGHWAFVADADSDTPAANFDSATPIEGVKFDK